MGKARAAGENWQPLLFLTDEKGGYEKVFVKICDNSDISCIFAKRIRHGRLTLRKGKA